MERMSVCRSIGARIANEPRNRRGRYSGQLNALVDHWKGSLAGQAGHSGCRERIRVKRELTRKQLVCEESVIN